MKAKLSLITVILISIMAILAASNDNMLFVTVDILLVILNVAAFLWVNLDD